MRSARFRVFLALSVRPPAHRRPRRRPRTRESPTPRTAKEKRSRTGSRGSSSARSARFEEGVSSRSPACATAATFYFGATGGGVWKTTDGGSNWEVVSDKDFQTGSIGAIAVSESDPNVVYVGHGRGAIRGNVSHGDGVYKSTDAGRTWKNVGLKDTRQISRVRIHPKNPDLVYVAAPGHAWGPNAERGSLPVRRRREDVEEDPVRGRQDRRLGPRDGPVQPAHPLRRASGRSSDARGSSCRADRAVEPLEVDRRRRHVEEADRRVCPRGSGARSASRPRAAAARPRLRVRRGQARRPLPQRGLRREVHARQRRAQDPRAGLVLLVGLRRSEERRPRLPAERPAAQVDRRRQDLREPARAPRRQPRHVDRSRRSRTGSSSATTAARPSRTTAGKSWSTQDNQPTAQFYRVTTDNQFPYWVYGSQQDNSNVAIPSGVPGDAIDRTDWHAVGGGESGWIAVDPKDPNIVYAGEYGGIITRYDHRTKQARDRHGLAAAGRRPRDERPEIPDPVERADRDLAERPQGPVSRRADPAAQPRRRRDVGGDVAGPDAQRQGQAGQVGRADHDRRHRRRGLRHDLRPRRSRRRSPA